MTPRPSRRGPWRAVELANEQVTATLLPGNGCDIVELVDRRSGVDVLLKAPWGFGRRPVSAPSSFEAWIEAYPGGWQVLLPNGGAASVEHGVEWGFHGEAGLIEWRVEELRPDAASFAASLITAPLEIARTVALDGATVRVTERVTNAGGVPIEVMWGHHPAFGAPFLEPGCRIETGARSFTADDEAPGAGLEPGRRGTWPLVTLADGSTLDLSVIPPADVRRAVLGYLGDFDEGAYSIVNPRLGLRATVRWPLEVFPFAWFWQELHATPGYPWYQRLYTTAVEPNTTIPAQGVARARAKGRSLLRLEAGASREAVIEAELAAG